MKGQELAVTSVLLAYQSMKYSYTAVVVMFPAQQYENRSLNLCISLTDFLL